MADSKDKDGKRNARKTTKGTTSASVKRRVSSKKNPFHIVGIGASAEGLEATNEELKSANEELQSLNEELLTVNAELSQKTEMLSKANDDMKNYLNRTDIAIVFLDNELNIRSYTPATADVFNIREVEIGRPLDEITSRLAYESVVDNAWEVLRTLGPKEIEVQRKDGHWYIMRILPYLTTSNEVSGLVMSFLDIDKQRKAVDELAIANQQLEDLSKFPLENPNPVLRVDRDGTILYVNAACAMLDFKCQPGQVLPRQYQKIAAEVLGNGSRQLIEVEGKEFIFVLDFVPVTSAGYVNIYGNDVTERKQVEENLRQTRDYLDNLFNYTNAPIIVWSPKSEITRFNHAFERLTGRTAGEVLGKKLDILFPADNRDESMKHIHEATSGERLEVVEIPIQHVDGSVRTVLWNSATLYTPDGKTPVATIAQGQDITERKQAEEVLIRMNEELEERVEERTSELRQTNVSLRLEQARLDALLRLSQMSEASVDEMAGFVLEQGIAKTQSKIGFVGFLNEDESVYILHAVSQDVVKECAVEGNPLHWPVAEAGIWADAVRKRRTLFINDYSKPHPSKKGLPAGHPPVSTLMVVPLLENNKIVAVAGIGNKDSDYDESDERQITLLLRGMWNNVQKYLSEQALKEAYDELENRVEQRTRELQETQNDLKRAQAVAQTGSWRLDVQSNELLWSEENHRMFGIPVGTPMTYETFLSCVHPEDREYVDTKWNEALQGEEYDIEHRIISGDEVKWVRERTELEFDEQGMLRGGFGTTQDITELKKAEEQLAFQSRLLDTIEDYVVASDFEGLITYWGKGTARLLGWQPEEVIGLDAVDVLFPEESRQRPQELRQQLRGGQSWSGEITVRRRDGAMISLLINGSPVLDKDGNVTSVISVGKDITELKKVDQMKDEFIGLVSHELRTPLTVIIGSLRTAMSEGLSPADVSELIQNATDGAESLEAILENMLELSRWQADRLQLYMEVVNIADVAEGVIKKLKGQGASQRFLVDLPGDLPLVEADPTRVERILYNLVGNAAKYSPAESEIEVSCRKEGDFVVTSVSDQGQGIPLEQQKRLFELFERLEMQALTKGVGLGLVVCKRLVEAQGGWIKVDSDTGRGSTFSFALPIRRARE
jgi:PAS domain S-box-containing protein